jgi:hypothetical protein
MLQQYRECVYENVCVTSLFRAAGHPNNIDTKYIHLGIAAKHKVGDPSIFTA